MIKFRGSYQDQKIPLKRGQILLFDGHDRHWTGKIIHWLQKRRGFSEQAARWIHVCGVCTDGYLVDPKPPAISFNTIQSYMRGGYDIAVLTVKIPLVCDTSRALAFESMLGHAYGKIDLLWFILPRWLRRLGSLNMPGEFCSEMAATALKKTNELFYLTDKNPDQVFPADLFNEDFFDIDIYSASEE